MPKDMADTKCYSKSNRKAMTKIDNGTHQQILRMQKRLQMIFKGKISLNPEKSVELQQAQRQQVQQQQAK